MMFIKHPEDYEGLTPSHEAAVEFATQFMELHRIHWPGFEGESEVRPLEDMPSDTPAA